MVGVAHDAVAISSPADDVVGAVSSAANQDGNTVDMNIAQTKSDDKRKGDPEQKDESETKTSSARYYTDIYGRVPGKEPKYPIPCPSKCKDIILNN